MSKYGTKVFAKNKKKELETLIQTIRISNQDNMRKFDKKSCANIIRLGEK